MTVYYSSRLNFVFILSLGMTSSISYSDIVADIIFTQCLAAESASKYLNQKIYIYDIVGIFFISELILYQGVYLSKKQTLTNTYIAYIPELFQRNKLSLESYLALVNKERFTVSSDNIGVYLKYALRVDNQSNRARSSSLAEILSNDEDTTDAQIQEF